MLPPVLRTHRQSADVMRELLAHARATPLLFRQALTSVPPRERDAWLDRVFELDVPPADGPALPRGCVPYLPCPVDAVLRVVEHANVRASDVFVDLGAGVGRAAALVHLLTGASTIGIEIQPALVLASRGLTERLKGVRFASVEGDAARLAGYITIGSIFFLYCPFGGERLEGVLDGLEPIAHTRPIRVCSVDLPLPRRSWLEAASEGAEGLAVYRSTLLDPMQ
jgi:SAM-dependent methyltransferase